LLAPPGGTIPITKSPIVDYQFASIVVQRILLPLGKKVLSELQRLTLQKNKAQWLTLLLANFILLQSYGLLMKQQRNFALKRKAKVLLSLPTWRKAY
jgi:hypothetical protein